MGIEISSIENAQLRYAAETADTKGKHSGNARIDRNELSIFKKEAKKQGCSKDEMKAVCKQVQAEYTTQRRHDRAATAKAYGTYCGASVGVSAAIKVFSPIMAKCSQGLSSGDIKLANDAADKIISTVTSLGKKGVTICNNASAMNFNNKFLNKIINFSGLNDYANGKNAAYSPNIKIININREKLPLTTFHELGHAYNDLNTSFWHKMQKIRQPAIQLALLFATLPAFIKKAEPEDGKELTGWQKFKNGFRKACPILATASMLPVVAEEAMATARGNSWAKSLLSSNLHKKVCLSNAVGLTSYIAMAAGIGLCSYLAMKVKDKNS